MGVSEAGLFYGLFAGLVAILFAQEGLHRIIAAILAGALTTVIIAPIFHYIIGDLNKYYFQKIGTIVGTVLVIVFPLAAIVALIETTTAGNYVRGALVGAIISVLAREFNTQAVKSLFGTAKSDSYSHVLPLYYALLLGILDLNDCVSIMVAIFAH
ncbi:MAG: hypothetical protein MJE68_26350, partial [Proteobacteria bacterium]|nr:hypothetical protein [Pseudomonadota bacterium]